MRVAAFSLAGLPMEEPRGYAAALSTLMAKFQVKLAVLPAHTSFLLCAAGGGLGETGDFRDSFKLFMQESTRWNDQYLRLHSSLAKENALHLVAGTTVEEADGVFYHTSYCFGPDGEICGWQRQTHLSREERALGLGRGEELRLFDLAGMRTGLIVGTDALHPEVGRIFALEGADLVAHSGALAAGRDSLAQPARIWAQAQQNQFWAVEAQLKGSIRLRSFGGQSAVIGPCEVTPGATGYLDRATAEESFALAELVEADRQKIMVDYPLLRLLRPEAYRGLPPEFNR